MQVKGKHTEHTVPTQGIEGTLLSPDGAQCLKPPPMLLCNALWSRIQVSKLVASSLFIFPPTNMAYALNQEEGLKVIAHNITHGSSESRSPKIHIKMPFICLKYLEQSIRYQWIQRKLKKQLSQFHKLAF